MPELTQQSSPAPVPPGQSQPAEPPSRRYDWEEHPAFRFAFLALFTQEGDREALEHLGVMLYDMALEVLGTWPKPQESTTRGEMRAAAQDLRHLEAYLESIGAERETASLGSDDTSMSTLAAKLAPQAGQFAGTIESELAGD